MIETIIEFISKACSSAWCSRASMVGVVLLSFWAVAHASDGRVNEERRVNDNAVAVQAVKEVKIEQERMRSEIEKARVEALAANAETSRRLDELQKLLIQLLAESRRRN